MAGFIRDIDPSKRHEGLTWFHESGSPCVLLGESSTCEFAKRLWGSQQEEAEEYARQGDAVHSNEGNEGVLLGSLGTVEPSHETHKPRGIGFKMSAVGLGVVAT